MGVLAAVDSRGEWDRGGGVVSWESSFTVGGCEEAEGKSRWDGSAWGAGRAKSVAACGVAYKTAGGQA